MIGNPEKKFEDVEDIEDVVGEDVVEDEDEDNEDTTAFFMDLSSSVSELSAASSSKPVDHSIVSTSELIVSLREVQSQKIYREFF